MKETFWRGDMEGSSSPDGNDTPPEMIPEADELSRFNALISSGDQECNRAKYEQAMEVCKRMVSSNGDVERTDPTEQDEDFKKKWTDLEEYAFYKHTKASNAG